MNSHFEEIRAAVDAELKGIFERRGKIIPGALLASMKYSVFAGGKRLRPALVCAAAEAVGGSRAAALPTAAAFEMIHTYTLIHDDLPAMDNDDLRRGMLTNHKKFGEATAILAGDGLLTLAFEVMAERPAGGGPNAEIILRVIRTVAEAVGAAGTVGGQQSDMENEGKHPPLEVLEYIHRHKTGTMITAAAETGAMIGGADEPAIAALAEYGRKIGHAFQVFDDILDVTSDPATMGKNTGGDARKQKTTYPLLMGLEASEKYGKKLIGEAIDSLGAVKGDTGFLKDLARYVGERKK